ncbi:MULTISPECIES: EpsG family protein [Sphingobacterium]|uniref:EpsG family protein n=1 Tax=Sphingobacterium TaxID=28453 RepID=UPI00257981AB|nr:MULTISPECIES: EpsG family protein [Sphingobacterium]
MLKKNSLKAANVLLLFIFLTSLFGSFFGGILLFICASLLFKRVPISYFLFVVFVFSVVAFTQFTTTTQGNYDIVRYYMYYNLFANTTLNESWLFILDAGDPFFHILQFCIAQIFPDDPRMLSFILLFLNGGLILYAAQNFRIYSMNAENREMGLGNLSLLFWFLGFFLLISFPNYTNVLRQYLAMALFFVAVSRKTIKKSSWQFFLFSVMSHWSILFYILVFFLLKWLKNKDRMILALSPFFGMILMVLLPVLPLTLRMKEYLLGEEILGIDKTMLLICLVVQIFLVYILRQIKSTNKNLYILSLMSLSYAFLFLFNSTISTRHFYFLGILLVIMFFVIQNNQTILLKNKVNSFLLMMIFLLFSFYNVKALLSGNFEYRIFKDNQYMNSVIGIFDTDFPAEMIR